jgi:hypothetical protein
MEAARGGFAFPDECEGEEGEVSLAEELAAELSSAGLSAMGLFDAAAFLAAALVFRAGRLLSEGVADEAGDLEDVSLVTWVLLRDGWAARKPRW